MTMDDDLLGLLSHVVAEVLLGVAVVLDQFGQKADVADGQAQCVHLGQSLFVGQGGDVGAQALEGVVDALHSASLAHVGGLSLLDLLLVTLLLLPPDLAGTVAILVVCRRVRW